ncbi:SpoIIE family protein phosphatase [Leptolyngbya sp. 'hensonii']|uniref:PP2C family protein-serine/threonine phosphatase n=1 Tax=Leptolyngbya sp. 'hensonii' TaxID=1922337 RepID=UPI00209B1644|nr:SpoIIE family protein phosphatase [Leptolyngbya sp. 'hensonii']
MQTLEFLDRELGATLLTTKKLQQMRQSWNTLQQNQSNWSRETKAEYYNLIYRRIQDLRAQVGDQSNLILDPDLDTYYLMDTILLKLPDIQKNLVELQIISKEITRSKQITPVDKARLIVLLGIIQDGASDLQRNTETAFQNNPLHNLRPKLSSSVNQLIQDLQQLTTQINSILELKDPAKITLDAQTQLSLKDSFILWDKTLLELDFLLQHRIDGFIQKQVFISIFVCIILVIVTYLFIGFYRGVMQTISGLSSASKQMIAGSLQVAVTLDSRDELAEVVKSFNNIAGALVKANQEITGLNTQLQAENLRMSTELEVTRRLQQMILPLEEELAQLGGLDIAGFMEPAAEVGGDYYDVLHQNGKINIGIGDVTGHGLESGVVMIMAQTAVRTLIANGESDPARLLNAVNRIIYDNTRRMKSRKNMTLALLEYEAGALRLSGQHEELIVVRQDGTIEQVDTLDLGFPLGIESDITSFVAETKVNLQCGDIAILYTDGITEAMNAQRQQYGLERMYAVLQENRDRSVHEIRQAVIQDVMRHIGEQKVFDDITLVVMKQK